MTGNKFDGGKSRLDLIPPNALEEVGHVLAYGAEKYGQYNYLGGMAWTRLAGAILRHTYAWLRGEDLDPESGLSHISHAAASCLMLLEYIKRGKGEDDRYCDDIILEITIEDESERDDNKYI